MSKDYLYPLRCVHGFIHEQFSNYCERRRFFCAVLSSNTKKVILMGTPTHPNIGDSAIVLAEYIFLKKCGIPLNDIIELSFADLCKMNHSLKPILEKCRILCWHGGGNMGTLWFHEEDLRRRGLNNIPPSCSTLIFPQTIYYDDSENGQIEKKKSIPIYNGRAGLTIVAREQRSYQLMCNLYPNTEILVTPDIVLSCSADDFGVKKQHRKGILLCLRNDKERVISSESRKKIESYICTTGIPWRYTDMYSERPITKENRMEIVRQKMMEFASSKLVVTDRLHGMVFAAITGTPCLVFNNNNSKVIGTYEWLTELPYIRFVCSEKDLANIHDMLEMQDHTFDPVVLRSCFAPLKNRIISKIK